MDLTVNISYSFRLVETQVVKGFWYANVKNRFAQHWISVEIIKVHFTNASGTFLLDNIELKFEHFEIVIISI